MNTIEQRPELESSYKSSYSGSMITYMRAGWLRAVFFALVWWLLTDGDMGSWFIGFPVVLLAMSVSVSLLPGFSMSLFGIARFVPFFLWHSLRGGIDVAKRVLHPKLSISPAMVCYRWRLPPGLSRVFMANTVSLLPGTLSAELEEDQLHVHVLDHTTDFDSEMVLLEERVAQMFDQSLITPKSENAE